MERSIVFIALFAALIAVLGLIPKIALPFGVPITAQSLGVMLCGTVLGAKRGALAALLFVGLVALGLPLLAGGRGGLALFVSPTAGFLIGFPIAAFVTGWVMEHLKLPAISVSAIIASVVGCVLVLYLFGIVGMAVTMKTSLPAAAALVVWFIVGDLIKAVLAGLITHALYKARPQSVFART